MMITNHNSDKILVVLTKHYGFNFSLLPVNSQAGVETETGSSYVLDLHPFFNKVTYWLIIVDLTKVE